MMFPVGMLYCKFATGPTGSTAKNKRATVLAVRVRRVRRLCARVCLCCTNTSSGRVRGCCLDSWSPRAVRVHVCCAQAAVLIES